MFWFSVGAYLPTFCDPDPGSKVEYPLGPTATTKRITTSGERFPVTNITDITSENDCFEDEFPFKIGRFFRDELLVSGSGTIHQWLLNWFP